MAEPVDGMQGAVDLGDGLTPIDIWQGLHANARAWSEIPYSASQFQDRIRIDGTDLSVLKALSDFPADKWAMLCDAVGWTVYGAVGFSWCKGAQLQKVWDAWQTSGFQLIPLPEYERPARLLNPALLPQSRKVSELISATSPNALAFCAAIASRDAPLDFDMDKQHLETAPPQIAAFLKSRLLSKASRTSIEEETLAGWTSKIAGTPFDVWSE